ncbi:putative DNA-binding protein (MmcQ/YjbR family) [Alteromonadaceae bacterium 2753L.S.0a.02]|nr:putative DNA-binding protein (MmcQ/YjbR family) [Alteromonadaceae bacterium 2753L.S.0a.02]
MNLLRYNEFCESLPATTHVVQWGDSHVWKVGGKVFAIAGWAKSDDLAVSFKVSDNNYEILKDEPGFKPAPYLASRGMKWIQQLDTSGKKEDDLKYYIKESHRIVSMGLTKKLQKQLGLNQA